MRLIICMLLAKDIGSNSEMLVRSVGLMIDIGFASVFATAGILARRRYRWAIISGMTLCILDGLIFIWAAQWLSVAFHFWPSSV